MDVPAPATADDYYDNIHRATWIRRSAGLLTGGTLGAAYGAAVGAVAAFLPYALGALGVAGAAPVALPGVLAVASGAALFASAGAFLGVTLCTDVGANAGSISAGLAEKENRERAATALATDKAPASPAFTPPASKGLFNWRIAAVTTPLLTAFGALIAANPHPATSSALAMMTGSAGGLSGPAAIAASGAIFGMVGALLGMKNSVISNQMSNVYTKIITDNYFTRAPEKAAEVSVSAPQRMSPAPDAEKVLHASTQFSERRVSFQEVVALRNETAAGMAARR